MRAMHCLDCQSATHPKRQHPSSFRTEASVWTVALVFGLVVGAWNAVTSSHTPAANPTQPLQLSSVSAPADAQADEGVMLPARENTQGIVMTVGGWLLTKALAFVRVAWWLLPIPIVFSLWREFRTHPVCARCGSRSLIPAIEEE